MITKKIENIECIRTLDFPQKGAIHPERRSFEFFSEKNFKLGMDNEVRPFLNSLRCTHAVTSCLGGDLYCETFVPEDYHSVIVLFPGYSEFCEKYDEFSYYMIKQGFALCNFDLRGHGLSVREAATDPSKIYIKKFQTYVDDAYRVTTEIAVPLADDKPLFIFSHSMGGTIAALFLQQHPNIFTAAIFSSPMLQVGIKGIPLFLVRPTIKMLRYIGFAKSFTAVRKDFPPNLKFDSVKKNATSEERWQYHFNKRKADIRFQTWGGTYSWADESLNAIIRIFKSKNLKKIQTPILLFQSEFDETVYIGGQTAFAKAVSSVDLVFCSGANHELYNAKNFILEPWYTVLLNYLEGIINAYEKKR